MRKPTLKPRNPLFSSGPCTKRPGWNVNCLNGAILGRSHRAPEPKSKIIELLKLTHKLLKLPDDYRIAIVPGSDTGAVEMAMWSLLGKRGVDFLTWENFGDQWVIDAETQLTLLDSRIIRANYGEIVDLNLVSPSRDTVFVWNGTTSGVRVPNGDWISTDREGITICDATSAIFAYDLPWEKLDATTWSWQKVMGGEAGFGMLILSPRAINRINTFVPPWPIPKLFRLSKKGKFDNAVFEGNTINTVSLLTIEDALDSLRWIEREGGLNSMINRCTSNFEAVENWVNKTEWIEFLSQKLETRSRTSICLSLTASWFIELDEQARWKVVEEFCRLLELENAAYDINTHRAAPPGLRIWGGATVETSDIEALLPWLDWAWDNVSKNIERNEKFYA